jgi:hypothetical protein
MKPDWHFIQKPFPASEILERIGNILTETRSENAQRSTDQNPRPRLRSGCSTPQFNEIQEGRVTIFGSRKNEYLMLTEKVR